MHMAVILFTKYAQHYIGKYVAAKRRVQQLMHNDSERLEGYKETIEHCHEIRFQKQLLQTVEIWWRNAILKYSSCEYLKAKASKSVTHENTSKINRQALQNTAKSEIKQQQQQPRQHARHSDTVTWHGLAYVQRSRQDRL